MLDYRSVPSHLWCDQTHPNCTQGEAGSCFESRCMLATWGEGSRDVPGSNPCVFVKVKPCQRVHNTILQWFPLKSNTHQPICFKSSPGWSFNRWTQLGYLLSTSLAECCPSSIGQKIQDKPAWQCDFTFPSRYELAKHYIIHGAT